MDKKPTVCFDRSKTFDGSNILIRFNFKLERSGLFTAALLLLDNLGHFSGSNNNGSI